MKRISKRAWISKAWTAFSTLGMVILFVVSGCSKGTSVPATTTSTNGLSLMAEADSLSVWATEADIKVAQAVVSILQENAEQVCGLLQTACQFPVTVEVYPDQASFNKHVMNPDLRGFFAVSGNGIIQMVSPANPSPHKISNEDALLVTVHEFVHATLDEINPDLPTWLDEGTAVFIGPHAPYTMVCQSAFPFEIIPSFQELKDSYHHVQAPDLFAYTAVDFVVHEYGMEELNMILRSPDELEEVLGISETAFEGAWHAFIRSQYHSREVTP